MRIFAYYLPQFHRIPENDEWWGEGFTEWVNVKKARPLYHGHAQPKTPLNNNYYDLDNIETLKWQGELLKKYKVDGLIFYHYYFQGKKLLEKPAEMLLRNKDVSANFFFCWANHSWCRSWEGSKEVLLEQAYGNEKDWKGHFDYLLPFFKDSRYEKRKNRPVLMVFNTGFPEERKIFSYFDQRCKENGFDGICIIRTSYEAGETTWDTGRGAEYMELVHYREPTTAMNLYMKQLNSLPVKALNSVKRKLRAHNFKLVEKFNGDKLYRAMCRNYKKDGIIRGAFFEWDNTPRHSYRGYVITPVRKRMFKKYMRLVKDDEYLFINAWNEWAEGMMLEPTEKDRYKYLEWIRDVR